MGAMQIRISEMLDNASELIEENSKDGYMVDNDRIKEIVFSEIKYMRRKHKKEVCSCLNCNSGFGKYQCWCKGVITFCRGNRQ